MRIFLALLLLVSSLFLLVNSAFAEMKTSNIGLAVAEDVTKDENGLIVIDGIFSITSFKKFPGVDNFKVYTRWTGSGKHTVKAQVVDADDNLISDSEDVELNFAKDYSTYYQIFDFNNIVFSKPGIYWVEALLDGKVEFSIPLFIQLETEDLVFEDAPEKPVLIFSVPAVSVTEKDNGLQVVSGVFEYFMFKRFPSAYDFIIANTWYSGSGKVSQYIELLDPDNNTIYKSEPQQFDASPRWIATIYDELEDIIFPKPGIYLVRVYLDDKVIFNYPILVEEMQ
jgi:hypothetical protein